MLESSLLVVLRGLRRDRGYALINIVGLAVGIACFILLGLYLRSEFTYDQHFDKHAQIHRLVSVIDTNGKVNRAAQSSLVIGEMLKDEYPDVIEFVRIQNIGNDLRVDRDDHSQPE